MKNKLLIILVVVMLFTNFVYADEVVEDTEVKMEQHIVKWNLGVDVKDGEKEFIFLKNIEEIKKAKENNIYTFDGSEISVEIPKEFHLGQAGLISANTHLNGFVRIINNNPEDIKIENIMRLFEKEELEGKKRFFDSDELINYGNVYRFTEFLDTTGEEIFFETNSGERQCGKTIDGYFLLIPQKTGNFSFVIEVGENDEVYDRKEIEFEVKEPLEGVDYTYEINPELSQEILIRFRDTWKSDMEQQTVYFSDSVSLGKINEEFYLEINKSENVKSDYIGRIELKDEENYVIFDKNKMREGGFFAVNHIEMNPQEKSEISIMFTHPAWFHIRGGEVEGVKLTGRPHSKCCIGIDIMVDLNPKINFKNTIVSSADNIIKTDKEKSITFLKNKSKIPIILISFGIGIPAVSFLILLDMKKLRISLIKNEENLIFVMREGGRKEFVNTKISFLIENEEELIEKNVEIELATGESKNLSRIMEEIKTDNEQILGVKVVTEADKNYSDDTVIYLTNYVEKEVKQ